MRAEGSPGSTDASEGKLLSAFQSLEFLLRCFLFERTTPPEQREARGTDMYAQSVGSLVLLNPMTDFRSPKKLIRAYNSSLPKNRSAWCVDEEIASVRDAIAHGRVTAQRCG